MQERNSTPESQPNSHVLSYLPREGQTHYPHIRPGLYIFVQHKTTKEVFLFGSIHGHGHAIPLLHLVNKKILKLPNGDESWLGSAGEQVFGYGGELLGVCVLTGKYHDKLKLTEPTSTDTQLSQAYATWIKAKIEADNLPFERFFFRNEWSKLLFNVERRILLFTVAGHFRTVLNQEQEEELRQQLQLPDASANYPTKIGVTLEKLFLSIQKMSQEEAKKPKPLKTLTTCRSAIFHKPSVKNMAADFSTPPGLVRQIPPTPPLNSGATSNPSELIPSLRGLDLNIDEDAKEQMIKKSPLNAFSPKENEQTSHDKPDLLLFNNAKTQTTSPDQTPDNTKPSLSM